MPENAPGQAPIIDAVRSAVDGWYDREADEARRRLLRALLERVRWWRIVTARLDLAEAAVWEQGVGLEEDSADSLVPDLVGYYIYGDIVLEHLAAAALGRDAGGAWVAWIDQLDHEPLDSAIRALGRELDLMLRGTRNVLVVHRHPLHVESLGVSVPGGTSIEAFDLAALASGEASKDLGLVLLNHGLPAMPDFLDQLEALAHNGRRLGRQDRDTFRHWAKRLGMRSVPPLEISWRVSTLARLLADA